MSLFKQKKYARVRIIIAVLLCIGISVGILRIVVSSPEKVLADSFFKMDEGYGSNINDINQNVSVGTITGAVWKSDDLCFTGKCLYFDGSGDKVAFTDDADLDFIAADAFTITGWFRHPVIATNPDYLVTKHQAATAGGYKVYMDSDGDIVFGVDDDGTWDTADIIGGSQSKNYDDNKWHHFSAVKNGTTGIYLYVDGQLIDQDTSLTETGTLANAASFYIGIDADGSSNAWDGYLDEVKVYRSARTAAEVKADYLGGNPERGTAASFGPKSSFVSDGLIGLWRMDETNWTNDCTTGTALDSSGLGNHGKSCPSTTGPDPAVGKFSYAGSFDGTDDYVEIADTTALEFPNGTSFSISFWINDPALASDALVAKKGAPTGSNSGYEVDISGAGVISFYASDGTNQYQVDTAAGAVTAGTWTHVVAVYSDTSTEATEIYVNGQKTASTKTGTLSSVGDVGVNTRTINFGSESDGQNVFSGSLDDVRIYNRALSSIEAQQLYSWAPGPVGYWNFDQNTGQTGADISGNGNSVTLGTDSSANGDDPKWMQGKYGSALNFDGADDFVSVTDAGTSALDITGALTISAWIYKTAATASNGWADMVVKANSGATDANYWFQIHEDTGAEYLDMFFTNGTGSFEVRGTQPLSLNRWQYVTLVYSDTANTIQFYVDGIPQTGANVDVFGSNANLESLRTNDQDLRIGYTFTDQMFPGRIDDVKIYNYARTSGQIIEDMNGSHPAPGSPVGSDVAHWKFDENTGTTAYDSNPNALNLTLSAAGWSNGGKFNSSWDGTGGRWASISDAASADKLDFAASDNFSISAWVKSDSATNPGASGDIFIGKSNGAVAGYMMSFDQSGYVCGVIDDDATWTPLPDDYACSSTDYYDAQWHHVVFVKTGTTKIEMYVDGNLIGSDVSLAATGTLANSQPFVIGDASGVDNGNEFNGDIDEIKVFRSALTPAQVKLLYNQSAVSQWGALSTDVNGIATNSASRSYCPPGDTTANCAPVGYWKLDENTGTTAKDISVNANNGTLTNGPAWTMGKVGQGVSFDGTDDYITVPYSSAITMAGAQTIEFWWKPLVNWNSSSTGNTGIMSISNTGELDANADWAFFLFESGGTGCNDDDGRMRFGTYGNNIQTNTASWVAGQWYHIAVSYTDSSNAYFYVNGVMDNYSSDYAAGSIDGSTDNPLLIGKVNLDCGGPVGPLGIRQVVDDVKIYNYARTAAEIAWDYNRGKPFAWWKMDESSWTGAAGEVKDSSGNALHGARTDGATTTTGKFNRAGTFDGTSDLVTVTDPGTNSILDFKTGETITMTAWINPTALPASTDYDTIISKNDAAGDGWYIQYKGTGALEFCQFGTADTCFESTRTPVTAGSWQFVVLTHTFGTPSSTIFYLNGQAYTGTWAATPDSTPFADNSPIIIGADGFAMGENINGLIDDLRLYRYPLTQQQMRTIMNEGALRFGPLTGTP